MTCRKHPDMQRVLTHEREERRKERAEQAARLLKLATALNRYGRHEKGCPMLRAVERIAACNCGLHARIKEGGVNP